VAGEHLAERGRVRAVDEEVEVRLPGEGRPEVLVALPDAVRDPAGRRLGEEVGKSGQSARDPALLVRCEIASPELHGHSTHRRNDHSGGDRPWSGYRLRRLREGVPARIGGFPGWLIGHTVGVWRGIMHPRYSRFFNLWLHAVHRCRTLANA
jgi:hypothetical protein